MEGKELQHFFHEHPLILKAEEHITNRGNDHTEKEIHCNGCLLPISGPFYSCGECRYFLHKVCAELPSSLDHPLHPKHPLALLECAPYPDGYYYCDFCKERGSGLVYHCSICGFDLDMKCAFPTYKIKDKCHPHPLTPIQVPTALACHICRVQEKGLFYKCEVCPFWVHQNCTTEHSDHDHPYPFRVLQNFFHKHPLILKDERSKANGDNNHPDAEIKCNGCQIPILGPFYSCGECRYFLHKVCAELPSSLDHPLHPKHPLALLECAPYEDGDYYCRFCEERWSGLVYHCSVCSFDLDIKCAFPTYKIKDKCHPHPLTPIQVPTALACHICRVQEKGLFYKCDVCPFLVHQNCTAEHSDHDHPYPFRVLQHFFHKHPLILKAEEHITNGGIDHPEKEINCDGCEIPISGPFYSCGECRYFLHKVCAELPSKLDHPQHPQHPLTLYQTSYGSFRFGYRCSIGDPGGSNFYMDMKYASASQKIKDECHPHPLTPLQVPIAFVCHICRKKEEGLSYKCYSCPFWVHQNCTLKADTVEHSHREDPYPFVKLQHFFHDHPLILIANEHKAEDVIGHSNMEIECDGCGTQILGPFYSCGECRYFLHKVCAELPTELDHPLHPQHPLTLLRPSYDEFGCSLCRETVYKEIMVYNCSICSFYVDMKCASATHVIQDKCHPHPLTPVINLPISFPCNICLVEEKGPSYRCNICPFWVHQNCTLMIPDTAKHSDHDHLLKLFPSIPFEFSKFSKNCDICHSKLFMFQCIYGCDRCLFFAHVSCARSETIQSPSSSRDQNTDGQNSIYLPMKQDSTDWISRFVQKYIDGDANIDNKIDHFDHEHPLLLIDEKTADNKTCDSCAGRITPPSYGCVVGCDYFLHKCCTDLPKQIQDHPLHPQHQLTLQCAKRVSWCKCCCQYGNSFIYKCSECYFQIDIMCALILEGGAVVVYHEAHKHPLFSSVKPSSTFCTACGCVKYGNILEPEYMLQCKTCSFVLCFGCAMAPAVIKHRYGGKAEEPFRLTYSAPENHHYEDEYLCEICLRELNPKGWYYHCLFGDQFAQCMVKCGADSNIKYGKYHMLKYVHKEHSVKTISCKYDCSPCSKCRHPVRITDLYDGGGGAGYECKTCNFRCHPLCGKDS